MNRIALGAFGALFVAGLGSFWLQGRAEVERGAPPPSDRPVLSVQEDYADPELPEADMARFANLTGPALPEADELTKEQRRFFRYDRNRDWKISRNEMLATRVNSFRKLDKDGNNLLTFEEWAVTTVEKFDGADANRDRQLTPSEFLSTRSK